MKFFLRTLIFSLFITQPVFALTPNDPLYSEQWYLEKIGAPVVWEQTTGSSDVIVAVLDTGFDMDHPDLIGNLWTNPGEIEGDGIDNDGNGYIDDFHGYDFVEGDGTPLPDKTKPYDQAAVAHGTVIAGIIGATGSNAEGIAGINWDVHLMNVRILDNQGTGGSGSARDAIKYAVKNGADVINLSFTGDQIDPAFKNALHDAYEAGVTIVAAVGNTKGGGINVDETPIYPACHGENESEDWVIGVAASDATDFKSDFSNYGSLCTDVSAPGESIISTTFQDDNWRPFHEFYYEGGWSGTSLAVPMVVGAAALLKSVYPTIGPGEIETILRLSADPVFAGDEAKGKVGAGRLNIANAFELAPQFTNALTITDIPETGTNTLVKTACVGKVGIDDPCKTVYFYAKDGKRHAFPNEKVFFSWFENFDSVKEISKTSMSDLPLGKNVTYRPGTQLVKFQSVPIVYAVSKKGVLRPVVSEEIAVQLYGIDWNMKVHDIADVFFSNYTFGAKINTAADYNVEAEKASVTGLNDNF